jgi:hypothetical protein
MPQHKELRNIILNERSQEPNIVYYVIPLTYHTQNKKFYRDRKHSNSCMETVEGVKRSNFLNLYIGFPLGVMKMFWN